MIAHCNPFCQESDSKNYEMNRKAMTIVAVVIISLGFAACSDTEEEPQVTETWEVTALLTTTGLGDLGYNDQMYLGFCYVREELGCDVIVRSPSSAAEASAMAEEWMSAKVTTGQHRLLVLCDETYSEQVRQEGWQSTSDNVILQLDCNDETLPVYTRSMPLYGACYAVGRMMSELPDAADKHAAVVMANGEDKGIVEGRGGFAEGACEVGVNVDFYYLADKAGEGYNLADSVYHLCYDIAPETFFMLPLAGGSNNGVYRYGREKHANPIVTCALDADMAYTSYYSIFGIMKYVDQVILDFCRNWKDGTPNEQHAMCGLASGYVEIQTSPTYSGQLEDELEALLPEAIEQENKKYNP